MGFPFIIAVRDHDKAGDPRRLPPPARPGPRRGIRRGLRPGRTHRLAPAAGICCHEPPLFLRTGAACRRSATCITGRAVFTEAYAVMPRRVQSDITASLLPGWEATRAWILARPLSGFAETFAELILDIAPGGGSDRARARSRRRGRAVRARRRAHPRRLPAPPIDLTPGGFAYLPPGSALDAPRRRRAGGGGLDPQALRARPRHPRARAGRSPATPRSPRRDARDRGPLVDHPLRRSRRPAPRHAVTIVNLLPGAEVPFTETHVMEHGLWCCRAWASTG